MNDPAVNNWKQEGRLYLWKYKTSSNHSYYGLNLTSDKDSTNSLLELLIALQDTHDGKRTIKLSKTTDKVASVTGFNRPYEYYSKIKLNYEQGICETTVIIDGDNATLEIGLAGITELREALLSYGTGSYDFSINAEIKGGNKHDKSIWFW